MKRRVPIRLRLSITYALLFLVTGGTLIAITYALVAHNLNSSSVAAPIPDPRVLAHCKAAIAGAAAPSAGTKLPPGAVLSPKGSIAAAKGQDISSQCKAVFAAGASAGADDKRDQALHHLLLSSLIGLGALTLASGGMGWVLAGRVLAPVRQVTAAARRLSAENLDERLSLEGPKDELRELADTFDSMLGRLDAAFSSQRHFIGNASHELRTPLTIMRTELDVTLDRAASSKEDLRQMGTIVRDAVGRSERLVASLLQLATSEAGLGQTEEVDLGGLAQASVQAGQSMAEAKEVTLRSELSADVAAMGDEDLIQGMIDNLVDNAVLHNHVGGWAHVAVRATSEAAQLVVSSSGPELSEADIQVIFEPFRRLGADRQRSDRGVGLGLAIVSAVVSAHRGSLTATPIPGGGIQISVELPRARPLTSTTGRLAHAPQQIEAAEAAGVAARTDGVSSR